VISEAHLPEGSTSSSTLEGIEVPGATMAELERYAIMRTLEAADGSTVRAAEILDISVRTIHYRLHEYGVTKERARSSGSSGT
jgi:two-component system response regulator HydG